MCLIAHRIGSEEKRGSNMPNRVIEYNARANPDGFGIAWRDGGEIYHEKFAPKDREPFEQLLKRLDRDTTTEYVAHWRKATHGPVTRDFSHPFSYNDPVAGEVLVFHNGIIDISAPKTESDTSYFVKEILAHMEPKWWENPAYRYLVEQSVGWSRLLLMTREITTRLNRAAWTTENGIVYSTNPCGYVGTTTRYVWNPRGSTTTTRRTSAFGEIDDDDDDFLFDASRPAIAQGNYWLQAGHKLVAVGTPTVQDNGDKAGQITCETCKTEGEFYLIDGKFYPDIAHSFKRTNGEIVVVNPNASATTSRSSL